MSQEIPTQGPKREELREKGQFWTPEWVADAMVAYVLRDGADTLFDPAVGAGVFLRAASRIATEQGREIATYGTELDLTALEEARGWGLTVEQLHNVEIRDFVRNPPDQTFRAIVANPPYIRHHRLSVELKRELRSYSNGLLGRALDGRAGVHVYFLLRALEMLAPGGRLAFIMSADSCEGVFSEELWDWIAFRYRLDAVITFSPEATPFPKVDTNPLIYMIRNLPKQQELVWVRCVESDNPALKEWISGGLDTSGASGLEVTQRDLREALETGLSRPPVAPEQLGPPLSAFASVQRGIATGANQFFFLTVDEAAELGIRDEFLVLAVGRTRDVPSDTVDEETLARLDAAGRPTLLFSPDGRPKQSLPASVRAHLERGEAQGLPRRKLLQTRRPWYKMETREVPPILFAYLGRRNARFIRNLAGVVPLTGFLCVYPHSDSDEYLDRLWQVLSDPATVDNLALVGKSYGGGAIKVEPRALELHNALPDQGR